MPTPTLARASSRGWLTQDDCRLDDFRALVEQTTNLGDYPFAAAVEQNVLLYDSARLREHIDDAESRKAVQAELAAAMMDGPGIVVFKNAFEDTAVVDRATAVFQALLAEQKASGAAGGDHFAKPGANDRLWAALEKLAERDPEAFAAYYANEIIALAAVAWLGPNYQIISDLNVVNPGGQAQVAHRDYHLGFMEIEQAARYPAHVHRLSPVLTLQGAIAHCDMPVETGPTMYLPYSQRYVPGYMAAGLPQFREYFDAHYVQLPLAKGDAVFFNPAVFHGAGTNRSRDVERMANLLQISSAFGRMLETVDREKLSIALYPTLRRLKAEGPRSGGPRSGGPRSGGMDERALRNVIAASAEGYPFPTNLDRDQPVDSLNPESQAELVWRALAAGWDLDTFVQQLRAQTWRRQSGPARV